MLSTSTKIILGYIVLIGLLFGAIIYTFRQMDLLTEPTGLEEGIDERRHLTHRIISRLYESEIIGQTLRMGKLGEYSRYIEAMKDVNASMDTLATMLTDTLQQSRLDTVRMLLKSKQWNMFTVLETLQNSPIDALYQQQLDSLITVQDSLLNVPNVRHKIVTHHNSYTIRHKKKGFFKRLADVFAPKEDSVLVSNVVQEEYSDTINETYSPIDTITYMLTGIRHKVEESKQEQARLINKRIDKLRADGSSLSKRVNQLLESIDHDEREAAKMRLAQEREIRQKAAQTMAGIAIAAFLLVLLFSIVIARDIARSTHYRKELEKAKLYAENLLVAREKLMLTITHDIKAPAGSIMGYTDLMLRIVNDRRQEFYLNNMRSSAKHLLDLVTSLLDYHRLEAGKMDLRPVAFNVGELFAHIYNGFLPIAGKKGLEMNFRNNCDPSLTLEGDPFRIRQIVDNLLSNALKFTESGGITLETEYHANRLAFSIKDTGCGMTAQEQQRIFKEFTRLRSAQGQEGFGLGLSITRKLVELLHGEISVESVPGKGSTFRVSLPLPSAPSPTLEKEKVSPSAPVTMQDRLNILLIDDDRIQMNLTESMLRNIGGEKTDIRCCEHPEEVFNLLQVQEFDVVLTDIQMPAMNGIDLLHHIRSLQHPQAKTIPVIAITARGDMREEDFHTKGFAGMLQKPFSLAELQQVLTRALDGFTAKAQQHIDGGHSPIAKGLFIDFSPLTAFSENDPEAAREIMETFIKETGENVENMRQSAQEYNMESVRRTAHKMLPTFIMIGAEEAVKTLKWIESEGGKSGFTPESEKIIQEAIAQAEEIMEMAKKDNS